MKSVKLFANTINYECSTGNKRQARVFCLYIGQLWPRPVAGQGISAVKGALKLSVTNFSKYQQKEKYEQRKTFAIKAVTRQSRPGKAF